jgi:hypothetical protein
VRLEPFGTQVRHSLFQPRFVDIAEHHSCPAASELGGRGQPDPAGATRDDRSAPVKSD